MHTTTVSIFIDDSDDEQVEVEVWFYTPDDYEVAQESVNWRELSAAEWDRAVDAAPDAIADWYQSHAQLWAEAREDR